MILKDTGELVHMVTVCGTRLLLIVALFCRPGPRVVQIFVDFFNVASPVHFGFQHFPEDSHHAWCELFPLGRSLCRFPPLPVGKLCVVDVRGLGVLPGKVPGHHTKHQHREGPHVPGRRHGDVLVPEGLADLRRGVGNASVHFPNQSSFFSGHTEVH